MSTTSGCKDIGIIKSELTKTLFLFVSEWGIIIKKYYIINVEILYYKCRILYYKCRNKENNRFFNRKKNEVNEEKENL